MNGLDCFFGVGYLLWPKLAAIFKSVRPLQSNNSATCAVDPSSNPALTCN